MAFKMVRDKKKRARQGFTLIELSLSLIFVGTLALTVALVTNNMIVTYRRGLTLNSINTTGMDLVDEMRAALQNSSARSMESVCMSLVDGATEDACIENSGKKFISLTKTWNGTLNGEYVSNLPIYGVMCTGTYSYLWNSGYLLNGSIGEIGLTLTYEESDGSQVTKSGFSLLKIEDKNRMVCRKAMNFGDGDNYPTSGEITNMNIDVSDLGATAEEVLGVDKQDTSLALYDLHVNSVSNSEKIEGMFYSVSFILGTLEGGINVMATGNYCKTPEDTSEQTNFDYCAINKFNFAVQATGGYN